MLKKKLKLFKKQKTLFLKISGWPITPMGGLPTTKRVGGGPEWSQTPPNGPKVVAPPPECLVGPPRGILGVV
jgi:hypothetical protein